jgi:hypothetical protein
MDDIALPPTTHPATVAAMRAAPPLGEFDEAAALARMQRITFFRTMHANGKAAQLDPAQRAEWAAHQQRVAAYSQVKTPKPPQVTAPAPPPITALAPQAPRPVVPTLPQTPALAGVTRRAEMLTSLLGRPTPVASTDKPLV